MKTTNKTVLISGGSACISPAVAAEQFVAGLEQNEIEIRVGQTEDMYRLYSPLQKKHLK